MFKKNRTEVPQREYHGLRSHIFLQQDDPPGTNLAITWVDVPQVHVKCCTGMGRNRSMSLFKERDVCM